MILPIPPSVNHCWGHSRFGAYRKPRYKAWLAESAVAADQQAIQAVHGPVRVAVEVIPGKGWNIRRDIDNILKATLDFLGNHRLIDGDDCRTLQMLSVSLGMPETTACLRVTLSPIANPVTIHTEAEKRSARVALRRAQKEAGQKVAASTIQPVENETRHSAFPGLAELREIARASKARSRAMAEAISKRCCS